eukprot:6185541-Pyramimonas_sp.AAC.1
MALTFVYDASRASLRLRSLASEWSRPRAFHTTMRRPRKPCRSPGGRQGAHSGVLNPLGIVLHGEGLLELH